MTPKEKKELTGYLKKETDRLNRAIRKAHESQRFGRVADYERMRDAFANTLNKLQITNDEPYPDKCGSDKSADSRKAEMKQMTND